MRHIRCNRQKNYSRYELYYVFCNQTGGSQDFLNFSEGQVWKYPDEGRKFAEFFGRG
jgi:hypothetical protein